MDMKKLLALILALVMTVCLFAACGEKEETVADPSGEVRPLAEEALELIVKRDQETLLTKLSDPDPVVDPGKSIVAKFDAYAAVLTGFEAQVDTWEITDELKAEVKAYAVAKADAVLASFKAEGIQSVNTVGAVVNANGKAKLLDVSAKEFDYGYAELYTAPGNMAEFVGVDFGGAHPAKKVLPSATPEEVTANSDIAAKCTAADADALAKIKTMTIDELKVVTDNIFAKIDTYVVDTDVSISYKKIDNAWKINSIGISAVE